MFMKEKFPRINQKEMVEKPSKILVCIKVNLGKGRGKDLEECFMKIKNFTLVNGAMIIKMEQVPIFIKTTLYIRVNLKMTQDKAKEN